MPPVEALSHRPGSKPSTMATSPGLTAKLVREKLPKSIATVKGHLNRQRKNIRSTQPRAIETNANEDSNPPSDSPNQRSHHVFAAVTDVTGQISTVLTGQFPITSGRGNKYILVLYHYDSNAILAEPMKNRSDNEHLRAYNKLHQFIVEPGFKPCKSSTTKPPTHSNGQCETKTLTSNSCRHTHIVATPPIVPYKRSKITSWHACAQPTSCFQ
jgi:hypothetical protein